MEKLFHKINTLYFENDVVGAIVTLSVAGIYVLVIYCAGL